MVMSAEDLDGYRRARLASMRRSRHSWECAVCGLIVQPDDGIEYQQAGGWFTEHDACRNEEGDANAGDR